MKKKYFLYIIVVVLFNSAFSPITQINNVMETLQAITNEANKATELIKQQNNQENYQAQPEPTEQITRNKTEPLYFNGSGDDLLLVKISPKIYPYVYVVNKGSSYFSVKGFDKAEKYILIANEVGRYSGFSFLADAYVGTIESIEIHGGKNWELLFLPENDDSIKTYSAPIIISGDEPSIFRIDNAGQIVEADIQGTEYSLVKQVNSQWRSNLLINTVAPYTGNVRFAKDSSLVVVDSNSSWTMKFHGLNNESPEDSVLINYQISPDLKSISSETIDPTKEPEIEIIQTRLGQKVNCGDKFEFVYYYQPIMTKSQSYQTAVGKFLLARVFITNMTHEVIDGLSPLSFKITGIFNGLKESFDLDAGSSWSTSYRWEIGQITDNFIPGVKVDTFLVFDVPAKADEWYLTFEPREISSLKPFCSVNMSIPKINYVD
jgi:hypothetical protein